MNIDKALEKLKSFKCDFIIFGIKSNGIKSIPIQYELYVVPATILDVDEKLSEFDSFRVFDANENEHTNATWKHRTEVYLKDKTEFEERKLLKKLKEKYE